MMFRKFLSTTALTVALLAGVVATVDQTLVTPAAAADTFAPEVGKPLMEAQNLLKSRNYSGALAKANQAANAGSLRPHEKYAVGMIMYSAANGVADVGAMQKGLDLAAASGKVSGGDKKKYEKGILEAYSRKRQWDQVISAGNAYMARNGQDGDVIAMIAQANMSKGDVKGAEAALKKVVASGGGTANVYDALISVQYKIGGNDYAFPTMMEKLRKYPSADSWGKVIAMTEKSAKSDVAAAELYRLRDMTGSLRAADYVTAGKQMMIINRYADAVSILDKGVKAGVVGQGAAGARDLKLLESAKAGAAKAKAGFARTEAMALRSPNGQALVTAGGTADANGDSAKAIELIQKGIEKGGLRSVEDAQLALGVAQLHAGQKSAAAKTFAGIKGKAAAAGVAKLYSIYMR